ncbi:hypothetical protein Hanom_Chr09g00785691 [Helianthus anomalus]
MKCKKPSFYVNVIFVYTVFGTDSFMISAFIVKGEVECGNCRKVEEGHWFILDRLWPSPEYEVHNSDILGYASDPTPPGSAPFPRYSVHADAVFK